MDSNNPNQVPPAAQPRDAKELATLVLVAASLAGIVFVAVILPAEFGRDPTGFGRLTGIGDVANGGNEVDLGDRVGAISRVEESRPQNHTFVLQLGGLQDNEYKLHLLANQSIVYAWKSTGPVNFDFHGDFDDPARAGDFSSYEASQGTSRSGSFQAPFDGRHGWYFQNIGDQPVTITIEVWGYYEVIGLVG